jgi:hypothetical protein
MPIDYLTTLLTVVLAVSLAGERLVTYVKTMIPWLAEEQKTEAKEVDLTRDRNRRVIVLLLALAASWLAASFLVEEAWTVAALWGKVPIASSNATIPVPLLGLLASGGSAFWNNILGFTKAAKDTKQVEKASTTLAFHTQAEAEGKRAFDSGMVANANRPGGADALQQARDRADAGVASLVRGAQPSLGRGRNGGAK